MLLAASGSLLFKDKTRRWWDGDQQARQRMFGRRAHSSPRASTRARVSLICSPIGAFRLDRVTEIAQVDTCVVDPPDVQSPACLVR